MSATRDLARFVADTSYADLPPDVVHATKRCLVNAAGCPACSRSLFP